MVSVTFLKCSRCHTIMVFSVVRVVRCDCGLVNNVVGHTLLRYSGKVFLLSQLQLSVSIFCDWLFLITCALSLVIIDLTLFLQL
jgi:hypothetical protein